MEKVFFCKKIRNSFGIVLREALGWIFQDVFCANFFSESEASFGKAKATETRQPSQAAPQQEREALCWGRVVALW